jgi:predicted RNA binding protein YcfA (HicA-like mRNA interferase family)
MRGYTYSELCDILTQHGWQFKHQKGSHSTYHKPGIRYNICIPYHRGELCRPMVQRLLREAGIIN